MNKRPLGRIMTVCAVVVLLFAVLFLRLRLSQLQAQKARDAELLDRQREIIDALEHDLAMPREKYMEKDARERGYHQSGEIIFKNNGE